MTKPIDRDRLRAAARQVRPAPAAKRILVVDDDAEHRRWLARALEGEGWQVTEAENGRVGARRGSPRRRRT